MNRTLSIRREFTPYPGPRYRADGPFSGQQFREELLSPLLGSAVKDGSVLTVDLDDVAGYGSSFLEEAFGGLVREGYSLSQLKRHLRVVANTSRFKHHQLRAIQYMEEAAHRVAA